MVRKIGRAPPQPYSFYNVEAHGHLDTVHGLGRVVKQRNDVCTKCYGSSQFSYWLWELWPRPSPIGPPCPGGTWCDCMKSMSALSLRGCCVAICECFPTPRLRCVGPRNTDRMGSCHRMWGVIAPFSLLFLHTLPPLKRPRTYSRPCVGLASHLCHMRGPLSDLQRFLDF